MIYDCIIIGAGSGGLFAGLKLSSLGKKVLLLERQGTVGGLATTFVRKGFTFESAVHCVDALSPQQEVRSLLKSCGIEKKVEFIELRDFSRIIYPEHDFIADFDPVHFKDFLKKSFLREEKGIERIFTAIEEFYRQFDRFAKPDTFRWRSMAFAPLIYPAVFLTSFKTTEQFISKYIKDPQLKGIFTDIWRFLGLAPQRLSALYFLLTIRGYYFRRTSYIRGGSGKLFNAIAEKIKEKGNEVRLNTTVTEIIAEKSGLKTVVSDKGEAFQARTVISNANAVDTLTKLIQDKKLNERYATKLARFEKSLSAFQIYLGLKVPAKTLGMTAPLCSINITYDYNENFDFCLKSDFERAPLELVDHVQVDAGLAPAGKGTLLIMTVDNYANWQGLGEPEYKEKKAAYADILIRRAEKYLPGLRENIEVMEIATPLTVERFGAAPEGAIYGFAQTVRQAGFRRLAQDTPIKGLLLAGGWTFPGAGIHGCFVSGVLAANTVLGLLRKDAHHHGYI